MLLLLLGMRLGGSLHPSAAAAPFLGPRGVYPPRRSTNWLFPGRLASTQQLTSAGRGGSTPLAAAAEMLGRGGWTLTQQQYDSRGVDPPRADLGISGCHIGCF